MKYVKTLGKMTREDYLEAGGKAANLSEMSRKIKGLRDEP